MLHKKAEDSNLEEFEVMLSEVGARLLTATAELLMSSAAENIEPKIRKISYRQGFRKLEKRILTIRIFTGRVVKIPNLYARQVVRGYDGKRHLMALHWGIQRDLKTLLWNGNTDEIVNQLNTLFPKKTKEIERNINYFAKNKQRMQYADFQANNLLVGSGIMESGIRRVINLRFKNASSFWNLDNVEGLFSLRSIFLAGRWKNMINKLTATFWGHKS
jgi:hypothetical protein